MASIYLLCKGFNNAVFGFKHNQISDKSRKFEMGWGKKFKMGWGQCMGLSMSSYFLHF